MKKFVRINRISFLNLAFGQVGEKKIEAKTVYSSNTMKGFTPGAAIIMSSSESSIIKGLASPDDNSFVLFLSAGLENASEMEGCFGSTENVKMMQ